MIKFYVQLVGKTPVILSVTTKGRLTGLLSRTWGPWVTEGLFLPESEKTGRGSVPYEGRNLTMVLFFPSVLERLSARGLRGCEVRRKACVEGDDSWTHVKVVQSTELYYLVFTKYKIIYKRNHVEFKIGKFTEREIPKSYSVLPTYFLWRHVEPL